MKKGFTLAEILITLSIVGIVSVMTVPSLVSNHQKRILTTQLKKTISEISQAGSLAVSEDMSPTFSGCKAVQEKKFIKKYIKTQEGEGFAEWDEYTYANDPNQNYSISRDIGYNYTCGKMISGAGICYNYDNGMGFIDVNGPDGPNEVGRDAFTIGFNDDGTVNVKYSPYLENIISNDWDIDKFDN